MLIKKCPKCGKYTLKKKCLKKKCNVETVTAHPFKFSLVKEKKYGKYRKIA